MTQERFNTLFAKGFLTALLPELCLIGLAIQLGHIKKDRETQPQINNQTTP